MNPAAKTQTLEDQLSLIRENLKAGSARLVDVSGSFRVDFPSGQTVYIYTETYDNTITARFETKTTDPEARRRESGQARDDLVREISFADIPAFKEDRPLKGRFSYTTRVNVDPSVFFHEAIVMGGSPAAADGGAGKRVVGAAPVIDAPAGKPEAIDSQGLAEDALNRLESIDAKMLRLSLDMMNLKRSSPVRAALTRIFREALDAKELMRAIENEANRLTSPSDQEELCMVNEINNDEALEPVIRLLYSRVLKNIPPS